MFDFSANDGYDNNYQVDGGLNVARQESYRKLANVLLLRQNREYLLRT